MNWVQSLTDEATVDVKLQLLLLKWRFDWMWNWVQNQFDCIVCSQCDGIGDVTLEYLLF